GLAAAQPRREPRGGGSRTDVAVFPIGHRWRGGRGRGCQELGPAASGAGPLRRGLHAGGPARAAERAQGTLGAGGSAVAEPRVRGAGAGDGAQRVLSALERLLRGCAEAAHLHLRRPRRRDPRAGLSRRGRAPLLPAPPLSAGVRGAGRHADLAGHLHGPPGGAAPP
ncbi:hypothetical protein H632_c5664p0, partial [Helicosporidium sp. ATCC 50920]